MMAPVEKLSCKHLHDLIQASKASLLILDCRPFIIYNAEHIQSSCNALCPPILKRRSGGFIPLTQLIPSETKRTRLLAGIYNKVVIYDDQSSDGSLLDCNSNVFCIIQSLRSYMCNIQIFFLIGGFSMFKNAYPDLCTNRQSLDCFSISCEPTYIPNSTKKLGPVEIVPCLYLGDREHAADLDLLKYLHISAVLNVSTTCRNHFPDEFKYKIIPVDDSSCAELSLWFPHAINFIDAERLTGGKVLIHCVGGVSRSATICMAYLMYSQRRTLDDAFSLVKSRRSIVSPNLNFMRQLHEYEKELENDRPRFTSVSCPPSASCAKSFTDIWNNLASHSDFNEYFSESTQIFSDNPVTQSPLRSISSPVMCFNPLLSPS